MSVLKLAVLFAGVPAAILVGVTVLVYLPSLFSRRRRAEQGTTVPAKRDPVARQAVRGGANAAESSAHADESGAVAAH